MGCEVWEFKKCCFCIPLRYGLQLWVYFKLLTGLIIMGYFAMVLIDIIYIIVKYEMMSILDRELILTAFMFTAIFIDNIFHVVFIISAHRKHHRLMRVYYIYLLVVFGLLIPPILLTIVYEIFVGDIIIQTFKDDPRLFIQQYITLLAQVAQYLEFVYVSKILLLIGFYAANLPQLDSASFSISSIMDAALPALHPIVAAGSSRCEAFKSFFGLTYEQMQNKNISVHEALNIDLITKHGNVKYNLTATKQLRKVMANARAIVILIHGFMESSDGWMVQGLTPELLKRRDLKIFALDGRKIINLEYFRSSTYARFMGEQLGTCLSNIIKNGQDPAKMTLVGHSLGAHIAGIAGKRIHMLTGQQLNRITALDPAGPCFSNVSIASRLDRNDALYVDVIHTNAGMLGLKEPVGHKDFYPNGGMSQPGCILSICDHSRAWILYAESINSPKHFPAHKCDNWTMFTEGLCSKNNLSYMGVDSHAGQPGIYYLNTGSSSPFGLVSAGSG